MKNAINTTSLLLLLFVSIQIAYGQSDKEKAQEKGREAIGLMDNGKIDESITLLREAEKLDPDRFDYPYEMALAYYMKEDYKESIKILEKLLTHKDVNERAYQLLGNSYDLSGKSDKAFKVYDAGLKKFPNSGMIYLEKGNVHWNKKEYAEALPYYEKGIEVDPKFPSNYYRATRIYCGSSEEVWGLIYGEIFMNLERNSQRTAEISELLYNTYKTQITISGDSARIDFCNVVMSAENLVGDKIKLPFCMLFGQAFIMAIIDVKEIDIHSLDKIRKSFVENYFSMGHNKTYPNVLYDYQDKILKAGHLEAYNHWILLKGDESGFTTWQDANTEKWDAFVKWFTDNKLILDNSNKFYSAQY